MTTKEANEILDALNKARKFLEKNDSPVIEVEPSEDTQHLEMLEITIDEQRRVYDGLMSNYWHVKTRTLAFLGAGFAVMTFIYAEGDTFFPEQTYGQVLYGVACLLIIYGFGTLFIALQSAQWEYPTERARLKEFDFADKKRYLEYIVARYITCYDNNVKVCEEKHKHLRNSFYPLVIGAIILVLLKIFKEGITS